MIENEVKLFKEKLENHISTVLKRRSCCQTEEACKQALILPFISLLGYDIFDVNEVTPEHTADFSDKYKNRVDYAILKDGKPVIAIECKQKIEKTDRGQLKSYFNACKSIKLGILTDGTVYEFFADRDSQNIMDDEPFFRFDFNSHIDDEQIKAILTFSKTEFNPDNVGAEAKKKVISSSIVSFLENNLESPSEDFITYLLKNSEGINQKITKKVLDENSELVKNAFQGFIDKKILERVGLADKQFIKIEEKKESQINSSIAVTSNIVTTDEEVFAYTYAKQRLAFLIDTDELYLGLDELQYKDFKTIFTVYYKREKSGKLFNFIENPDGSKSFIFPKLNNKEIKCDNKEYKCIDKALLESYKIAVETIK